MKKLILLIAGMALFINSSTAQLITCTPTLPTDQDAVTITFDASLGNQGLKDFTGDVYAHTGVITNLSANNGDWKHLIALWNVNLAKAKMTYQGNNKFQLTIGPSIREFYQVPAGETIQKLAFVFRNSNGTKQGKTSTGGDIFYDVYEVGLAVNITSPATQPYFVDAGSNFNLHVEATLATTTTVKIDNQIVHTETNSPNSFDYNVNSETTGSHWIVVEASKTGETVKDSMYYVVRSSSPIAILPFGVHDGINYIDDNTVTLVLHAPFKNSVYVIGDFNNWQATSDYIMSKTLASDTDPELRFWITLDGLTAGKEYIFQYLVDETLKIAEPYADKICDPWNDKDIASATYPNLITFPEGKTDGIASVFQTSQNLYTWKNTDFISPKVEDLVIYELLIRDFTANANYQTMIDTLSYLQSLGINAIELMPINEFDGNDSWGYNPAFYFAPDKAYGTKDKFKEFIDSCHQNGIAVIIDMVLNHSYGQSPLVRLYFDPDAGTYGQPSVQNLWYNQVSPNSTYSWGFDFNHESNYTKQFVDSVNSYWLTYYKVDGFRFDFTKGFTNTVGEGWNYDASRIAILKQMFDKIKEVNPNAYIILEHLTDNTEETELSDYGMLLWGNMNSKYNEATMGYTDAGNSNISGVSYKQRGWTNPHLVSYMESHDEQRLMYKNITYGNSLGQYNIKNLWTGLPRIELAACFFITIPGPKMIWQFGELGYDVSIDFNGRVGKKPVRWNYYSENDRYRLFQVFSSLIKLKTKYDVFETTDYNIDLVNAAKWINLNGTDMNVTIIGNFGVTQVEVPLKVQNVGTWYDYFSGNSISVTDVNQLVTLKPGEYHIYTSVKLETPDIVSGIPKMNKDANQKVNLKVFPNPAKTATQLNFKLEENINDAEISIFNLNGQKIQTLYKGQLTIGERLLEWNLKNTNGQKVPSGLYLLKLNAGKLTGNSIILVE